MEKDTHSFIVRIWNAADVKSRDASGWRGSIDYVGSGRRLYFYDMESIVRFIREQVAGNTGMPVPARMPTLASIKGRLRAIWERIRLKV